MPIPKYEIVIGREFRGVMHDVRQMGLVPANLAELLRLRVEAIKAEDLGLKEKQRIANLPIHTADGIAYPRETAEYARRFGLGRFKFVLDAQPLMEVNPDTQPKNGLLPITDEMYEAIGGTEFMTVNADSPYNGYQELYAILANKFNANRQYSLEELYELGATRLVAPLITVKIGNKKINERMNSDLFLVFCGYDFTKDPNDPANQAAIELRAIYSNGVDQKYIPGINERLLNTPGGAYFYPQSNSSLVMMPLSLRPFKDGSSVHTVGLYGGYERLVGLHPSDKTLEQRLKVA